MADEISTPAAPAAARPAPRAAAAKAPPPPAPVRLTHPYGYFDDEGGFHTWSAGEIVTDADEIADLMKRGAPIVQEDAE